MYVRPNFRTKKAFKDAVLAGTRVEVFSPGPFPCPQDGHLCIEGPHYPEPHRWYAECVVEKGLVKKVK